MEQTLTITHLGLGNMGLALVQSYLHASHKTTIWNRTTTRPNVQAAISAGASLEPDLTTALSRSDTITLCLLDDKAIYQHFSGPATSGALAGKTVVNYTTATPQQARDLEAWFLGGERGAARFLHAALLAIPRQIGTREGLTVLSGADRPTFSALQPLWATLGRTSYRGPDMAAAALFDMALLSMFYSLLQGSMIMFALLSKQKQQDATTTATAHEDSEGEAPETALAPLTRGTMIPLIQDLLPYIGVLAEVTDQEDWPSNRGNAIAMSRAGLGKVLRACEEEGIDPVGLKALVGPVDRAIEEHDGEASFAAAGMYLFEKGDVEK